MLPWERCPGAPFSRPTPGREALGGNRLTYDLSPPAACPAGRGAGLVPVPASRAGSGAAGSLSPAAGFADTAPHLHARPRLIGCGGGGGRWWPHGCMGAGHVPFVLSPPR